MRVFADRLKDLRKEKGLSQAQLARAVGVSYGVVCYWETDRSEPTAPNIVKLADYFGVTADYLLGRVDFLNLYRAALGGKSRGRVVVLPFSGCNAQIAAEGKPRGRVGVYRLDWVVLRLPRVRSQ